jgi:hypothetical protein
VGVQFDRKDIEMNKVVVSRLSQFHTFDARTQHKDKGFASVTEKTASLGRRSGATSILPQNRDVSMVCAGTETLHLYQYHYPTSVG